MSWIRHSDVHILAVGEHIFTTDERFGSKYEDESGRFTLAIKRVEKSDEGTYECQISTKPTKSYVVHLTVSGEFYLKMRWICLKIHKVQFA